MLNKMYSLPEIEFVGGTSEELQFKMYRSDDNSLPFDLFGGEANFAIIHFTNKNGTPLLSRTMTVCADSDTLCYHILKVSLEPADTVDMFGKFVYQITVRDIDGNIDIPHQGIMNIHNNIDKPFLKSKQ